MPFAASRPIFYPLTDLADVASEKYQELVNCYFRHSPESNDDRQKEVIKTLGFTQSGTNAALPLAKRGLGIGSLTSSVGSVNGVYAAWDNATPDVQIYLLGAGDPTVPAGGAATRFVTEDTDVEFEQANNNLYVTNGIDSSLLLTASTGAWSTLASGTPYSGAGNIAKYLCWHNYMMFAARTVNAPNILYVSDAGDPTTFTGPVSKTFRHKIIGLRSLGDYLMVYTEKEIWAVTGLVPSTLSFRQLAQAHPSVSHRSIVTVIGADREYSVTGIQSGLAEHWYLANDYVWATNGSTFRILGKESWELYRSNLSTAQLQLSAATLDDKTGQYWISVPTGSATKNSVTWAYDAQADKWIEKPFFTASCWLKHGTPTPSMYFLDSAATGKAYLANSGNAVVSQKTTLSGAHTATVTTLTVASTTGFPTSGVVQVENEAISYSGVAAGSFTGCIRGYQGTTAATHADTTAVYPAMQFRYRTRNLDLGQNNLIKKYQILWVNVLPSTTAYSLSINTDTDQLGFSLAKNIPLITVGMTWGTDYWRQNPTTGLTTYWGQQSVILTPTNRVPLSGRGKTIKISLDEATSLKQTEVIQLELRSRPLKKK